MGSAPRSSSKAAACCCSQHTATLRAVDPEGAAVSGWAPSPADTVCGGEGAGRGGQGKGGKGDVETHSTEGNGRGRETKRQGGEKRRDERCVQIQINSVQRASVPAHYAHSVCVHLCFLAPAHRNHTAIPAHPQAAGSWAGCRAQRPSAAASPGAPPPRGPRPPGPQPRRAAGTRQDKESPKNQ